MSESLKVVAGLRCIRCGGCSTIQLDPKKGLVGDEIHACPHCFAPSIESKYTIKKMYDIVKVIPTTDEFEASHSVDECRFDYGSLTQNEFEHWRAIKVYGETYAQRARNCDINPGTVWQPVDSTINKLDPDDD